MSSRVLRFFFELQRRHVYKVGAAYVIAGWLLAQVVTQVLPVFDVPLGAQRILVIVLLAGFPVALILAWLFDVTPEGVVLTDTLPTAGESTLAKGMRRGMDRKLNWLLGGLLALALTCLGAEHLGLVPDFGPSPQGSPNQFARSIAVLPFENLSDDKANAYFAAGIQDQILTQIAKLGALHVISRTSTREYDSKPENLREIAKQLGVETVLEGSVQKVGDTVRVNVQLIRATTDDHLWAENYDRKLDDVFGVQNEIAEAVATQLDAKLSGADRRTLAAVPTRNAEAYDAYLRALAVLRRTDSGGTENQLSAIELLKKATEADPDFADAWAELSGIYLDRYSSYGEGPRLKPAKEAIETAIRLQPDSAKAWCFFGMYREYGLKDSDGAIEAYLHALRLAPNDPDALASLADLKNTMGSDQEALEEYQKLALLRPRDPDVFDSIAEIHYEQRRFGEARRTLLRQLELTNGQGDGVIAEVARTYLAEGDTVNAATELAKIKLDAGHYRYSRAVTFGLLAMQTREYAATIDALKRGAAAPQDVIDYATIYFEMGQLQICSGDRDGAKASFGAVASYLDSARKSNHISPLLPMHLGPTYAFLGKPDAARESAQEGLSQAGTSGEYIAFARTFMAMTEMFNGDFDAAVEQLAILEQHPGSNFAVPTPSIPQLRKECLWDPLRRNSKFKSLVRELQ